MIEEDKALERKFIDEAHIQRYYLASLLAGSFEIPLSSFLKKDVDRQFDEEGIDRFFGKEVTNILSEQTEKKAKDDTHKIDYLRIFKTIRGGLNQSAIRSNWDETKFSGKEIHKAADFYVKMIVRAGEQTLNNNVELLEIAILMENGLVGFDDSCLVNTTEINNDAITINPNLNHVTRLKLKKRAALLKAFNMLIDHVNFKRYAKLFEDWDKIAEAEPGEERDDQIRIWQFWHLVNPICFCLLDDGYSFQVQPIYADQAEKTDNYSNGTSSDNDGLVVEPQRVRYTEEGQKNLEILEEISQLTNTPLTLLVEFRPSETEVGLFDLSIEQCEKIYGKKAVRLLRNILTSPDREQKDELIQIINKENLIRETEITLADTRNVDFATALFKACLTLVMSSRGKGLITISDVLKYWSKFCDADGLNPRLGATVKRDALKPIAQKFGEDAAQVLLKATRQIYIEGDYWDGIFLDNLAGELAEKLIRKKSAKKP